MSSIYETPVSSPTYATPMEGRSPWASPRASLRLSKPEDNDSTVNGLNLPPQRGETAATRPFTGVIPTTNNHQSDKAFEMAEKESRIKFIDEDEDSSTTNSE